MLAWTLVCAALAGGANAYSWTETLCVRLDDPPPVLDLPCEGEATVHMTASIGHYVFSGAFTPARRTCHISGRVEWTLADGAAELVAQTNEQRRVTSMTLTMPNRTVTFSNGKCDGLGSVALRVERQEPECMCQVPLSAHGPSQQPTVQTSREPAIGRPTPSDRPYREPAIGRPTPSAHGPSRQPTVQTPSNTPSRAPFNEPSGTPAVYHVPSNTPSHAPFNEPSGTPSRAPFYGNSCDSTSKGPTRLGKGDDPQTVCE